MTKKILPFIDTSDTVTYITSSTGVITAIVDAIEYAPSKSMVSKKNGMDTSRIDPFRQGINITSHKQFYKSRLWKISSTGFFSRDGSNFHAISSEEFGMPKGHDDSIPFYDLVSKFVATGWIHDENTQTYPQSFFDPALRYPDTMDGVLEAYPIRESFTNTSIEFPNYSRGIKSTLMDGNSAVFGGTNIVEQKNREAETPIVDPFIEGANAVMIGFGLGSSGSDFSLPGPGYTSDIDRVIVPFKDDIEIPTNLYFSSSFQKGVLQSSLSINDRYQKSATAGTVYINNAFNVTDSIAYGGFMMRQVKSGTVSWMR